MIHDDVKDFYKNNLYVFPVDGLLDITVAIDGSFSHVGYQSSGGVSFVVEILTGRTLDYNYIEKCFSCKDSHLNTAYDNKCPKKLFHGSAGSMEVYNAIILFERSKQFGFRYSTYVADGDNKVYPALVKMKIYTHS